MNGGNTLTNKHETNATPHICLPNVKEVVCAEVMFKLR
jgi:hypothetical protein